jgi:hypothetical protein
VFYLLPPTKVISVIAAIYAASWVLVAAIMPQSAPFDVLRTAAIVDLALMLWGLWGWRKAWARFPILNHWLFPDLNGKWLATIHWVRGDKCGQADGQAHITQSFFKIAIEVVSQDSESETLVVVAKRDPESGRPMLHYMYLVKSKQVAAGIAPTYEGAALLKVSHADINHLQGNYFTSRATNGHFSFIRQRVQVAQDLPEAS